VWQANTIVANPDYDAMLPPLFDFAEMPLVEQPAVPSRWTRPGLWEAVRKAEADGVWWAELHGLHHLPATAWLAALRRGQDDARRALAQQSPIGTAVEASGEYDPSEPFELRARDLRRAIAAFRALFGRAPTSFCPPDHRFDEWLEEEAASLGVTTLQGKPEQAGHALPPLRRRFLGLRFPQWKRDRFQLPPRIQFEPCGDAKALGRRGLEAAIEGARAAWKRGHPAIVSTHRMNYAHLDEAWSAASRRALDQLLEQFCKDGAVFVTDHELRQLVEQQWSVREIASHGVLLRHYGVPRETLKLAAPADAVGAKFAGPHSDAKAELSVEEGVAEVRVNLGEHVIEWIRE
jgi:peptidoglycan/xylan/chitin deacetylase (PgdA/CDA1 family)